MDGFGHTVVHTRLWSGIMVEAHGSRLTGAGHWTPVKGQAPGCGNLGSRRLILIALGCED